MELISFSDWLKTVFDLVEYHDLFENIETEESVAVFNTHLDHIGDKAQHKGAELILEKLKNYEFVYCIV